MTSARLSATDHRCLSSPVSFHFSITYRAGKNSTVTRTAYHQCATAAVGVPDPYQMKSTSSPSWRGWILQRIQWFVHLTLFSLPVPSSQWTIRCKSSAGSSHWGHQYVFWGCKWHSIWKFWCVRGKSKLKDLWVDVPYEVLQRISGLPAYGVQQEGTEKIRAPHQYLLLPYHIQHEKGTPKQSPSQRVNHRLHHPRFSQDPHLEPDHSTSENQRYWCWGASGGSTANKWFHRLWHSALCTLYRWSSIGSSARKAPLLQPSCGLTRKQSSRAFQTNRIWPYILFPGPSYWWSCLVAESCCVVVPCDTH